MSHKFLLCISFFELIDSLNHKKIVFFGPLIISRLRPGPTWWPYGKIGPVYFVLDRVSNKAHSKRYVIFFNFFCQNARKYNLSQVCVPCVLPRVMSSSPQHLIRQYWLCITGLSEKMWFSHFAIGNKDT